MAHIQWSWAKSMMRTKSFTRNWTNWIRRSMVAKESLDELFCSIYDFYLKKPEIKIQEAMTMGENAYKLRKVFSKDYPELGNEIFMLVMLGIYPSIDKWSSTYNIAGNTKLPVREAIEDEIRKVHTLDIPDPYSGVATNLFQERIISHIEPLVSLGVIQYNKKRGYEIAQTYLWYLEHYRMQKP